MKKVDAVYSLLIDQVGVICDDNEKAERFSAQLTNDSDRDFFDDIFLAFSVEKEKLIACKDGLEVHDNLAALEALLTNFNEKYSQYPGFDYRKCIYALMIATRILQNVSSTIPSEDVDSGFDFFYCDLTFECKAFATNLNALHSNMVWINPGSKESLLELVNKTVGLELLYCLISFGGEIDFSSARSIVLCAAACVESREIKSSNVISLLKLHMLSAGNKITRSNVYTLPPSNSSIERYVPSNTYAQFNDVIHILGEYVDRKDVLAKYLSMYHVIENFMFKSQIVKLERKVVGSMFSIRDFKRLYNVVNVFETKAVENLVRSVFSLLHNGAPFGTFAFSSWQTFLQVENANLAKIQEFLANFMPPNQASNVAGNFFEYFSTLLYRVRNSIVHNKETEFHISSETYSVGCGLVIEKYLLPVLEEFVFLAMAEDNDVVWYRSNSIALWDQSA
ncbi:hypothetical protein [Pseudomonas sp. GV085]|uniref:hypothetical protein n=1 Tax=Pseudomonas sp. GV085 TaxID=2135756 RepID=UPI000D354A3F|nr:hypothetical protein [Pseudomonas sp. GV085]PTR29549.1 hypothetical protein C8K63_101437 [Pseudomonas sp. GV085]